MIRTITLSALLMGALSFSALASGPVELTEANAVKIRQMLTGDGYDVGKIKIEDGLYEAYARKDGKKYELYLDGDFALVRTELDD